MKGFFDTRTRQEVLDIAAGFAHVETETVLSTEASGRVLSVDVGSTCDVPHFDRAMMDGYAVRAEDVSRATAQTPVTLIVTGRVEMGRPAGCVVERGTAVEVGTGAALPDAADAVVMIEYTERLSDTAITVSRPVARYENIMRVGADFAKGEMLFHAGKRMAPKDIAAFISGGVTQVEVFKKPVATLISTGDELVPYDREPAVGQIRESNIAVLAALLERDGGVAVTAGIVGDEIDELKGAVERGVKSGDMVLISGGSSVGARDLTLAALESFGNSEVLVHGVAMRPGKPTILARIDAKPVIGLPGHPVSSVISYEVVVKPVLDQLAGCRRGVVGGRSGSVVRATLSERVPALTGRDEYIRVRFEREESGLVAVPLGRSSGAVSTLSKADGWVVVDMNSEGIEAGEEVEVTLF
jgi:molybdopterin molybdotransferase